MNFRELAKRLAIENKMPRAAWKGRGLREVWPVHESESQEGNPILEPLTGRRKSWCYKHLRLGPPALI